MPYLVSFAGGGIPADADAIVQSAPEDLLRILRRAATPLPCPASPYDPGGTGQPATCTGNDNRSNFYGAGEVNALAVVK